jgi:Family of unknown function (DUF5309)
MANKGIFVSDAGALAERSGSLADTMMREERGYGAPLFTMSARMTTTDCTDTMVQWSEEGVMSSRTIITAINAINGNLITVRDASWLMENTILMVESTGEYIMILGTTGNVLTVQRGMGGTPILPIVIGGAAEVGLQRIGTAFEEGSERPTGISTNPHPRTNLLEIFRNAWDITGTAQAVSYRHGSREARNMALAAMIHAEDIERSLIWGRRHIGMVHNKPFRMMDGVLAQVRSNMFLSPIGGLTRRPLIDYIERTFSKNIQGMPNERITFCGNATVRALNEIAMRYSSYQIMEAATTWGIKVTKFLTPFGDLSLIIHPMMNESPAWSGHMYSLHPGAMEKSWLRRTFHQNSDRQGAASDLRDATAGVYTSELTCKYHIESTASIMTDITVDHYTV